MIVQNLLLLFGGATMMFALSNGIWNRIAPAAPRNSDVKMSYPWRVATLIAGVIVFMTGFALLVLNVC